MAERRQGRIGEQDAYGALTSREINAAEALLMLNGVEAGAENPSHDPHVASATSAKAEQAMEQEGDPRSDDPANAEPAIGGDHGLTGFPWDAALNAYQNPGETPMQDPETTWRHFELHAHEDAKRLSETDKIELSAKMTDVWSNMTEECQMKLVVALVDVQLSLLPIHDARARGEAAREDDQMRVASEEGQIIDDPPRTPLVEASSRKIDAWKAHLAKLRLLADVQNEFRGYCSIESTECVQKWISRAQIHVEKMEHEVSRMAEEPHDSRNAEKQRRHAAGELSSSWVGSWDLGRGGFATAVLWVKQNSQGRIVDRVVVKDSNYGVSASLRKMWDNERNWARDPRDPNKWIPMEVKAMYDVRDRDGSEAIVEIRNWRINSDRYLQRLLLEFCPYGNLYQLIGWYNRSYTPIPEPFIWCVLESLSIAGILLERGELESNPVTDPPWTSIIHGDLKGSNVFLGIPSSQQWAGYPRPKMADFGFAIYEQHWNRGQMRGTRGSVAPEQAGFLFQGENSHRGVDSKTNVWGVGIIAYSLAMRTHGDRTVNFDIPQRRMPRLDPTKARHYSKELITLIQSCTNYWPEQRPSFDQILQEIQKITSQQMPNNPTRGLRALAVDDAQWSGFELSHDADRWKIGNILKHPQIPPLPLDKKIPDPPQVSPTSEESLGGPAGAELRSHSSRSRSHVSGEAGPDQNKRKADDESADD